MQTIGTDRLDGSDFGDVTDTWFGRAEATDATPLQMGSSGIGLPLVAATPAGPGDGGWFRNLWANEKTRHGLIVGAGVLVVCIGVALALIFGGSSTPAAETLGEGLAHAGDSYEAVSDDGTPSPSAITPETTVPPAAIEAPVGDAAASPADAGSNSSADPASDSDPPSEPPPSEPPTCPGTDPRCGPFRWDPAPAANQPLVLAPSLAVDGKAVGYDEARGAYVVPAGAAVSLMLTADDPDASFFGGGCRDIHIYIEVEGWQAADGLQDCAYPAVVDDRPYGANRPPDPAPGHSASTFRHDSIDAGTFTVRYSAESGNHTHCNIPSAGGDHGACNPYASAAEGVLTIIAE